MNDEIRKYQKRVIEILQRDYFPEKENWLIMEQPVMKNNSTRLDGVVIRKPYQRVSPTYYINGYYADGYTEEATAQAIYESYIKEQNVNIDAFEQVVNQISCYEKMKDKICYKLVNTEMNKDFLKDAPHIQFNDEFSLCFYIQIEPDATITIHNQFVNVWNLSKEKAVEELYYTAERNMMRIHPPVLDNMAYVLGYVAELEGIEELEGFKQMLESQFPLYVLTNEAKLFGASTIAYNNGQLLEACRQAIEKRTGQQVDSLVIVPSRVHEVMVMPAKDVEDLNELREMIRQMNVEEVKPDERLSNNIFGYSKEDGFVQLTFDNREISR